MEFKNYFQTYGNYFWEWEDGGEVLAIPNESTIAYRGFIADILEKLAPNGLPPFGSLLLAIIATNPNGSGSLNCICSMLNDKLNEQELAVMKEAISFLKLLAELPAQYKAGKNRILVYQAIFERCHNILSTKNSVQLYERFSTIKDIDENFSSLNEFHREVFRKDFRCVALLGARFRDCNSIIESIAALPNLPDIELSPEETEPEEFPKKDFIEMLIANAKTFHAGSLIKHIWGGLNIPAHSTLPSQQPMGGVADLTNKGDFDKLLISEFAHEDIVFLSRLANNEALFIRREVPPISNDRSRVLLIDVSLKNWGTPKTVAFAVMLAIARHPKTRIPCSIFALGESFHPMPIDTIDNIIAGLQVLDGTLHSGHGLEAYFKANPPSDSSEVFLITERSTVRHPEMMRALTIHKDISYLIYTDTEGTIDVYKNQQNSKRHLQHLKVPLEKIWKKAPAPATIRQDVHNFFPILFRNGEKGKKVLITADGTVYQITRDCVLLKLHDKKAGNNKGWELLLQNVSFEASEFEIGLMENGNSIFLAFNRNTKTCILTNLTTGVKSACLFDTWQSTSILSFAFGNDSFYHRNNKGTWAISETGEITNADNISARLFIEREKALVDIAKRYPSGTSVFKNVNNVFINQVGNLVFNVHELVLKQNHHLKLEKTAFLQREIESVRDGENRFVFSDGSIIETIRAGVFVLKSSNSALPYIFVSSVINATVGVATEEEFAGNEYYNKSLKTISAIDFCKKYLNEFISQIQKGQQEK
jgi:hypothetical protein